VDVTLIETFSPKGSSSRREARIFEEQQSTKKGGLDHPEGIENPSSMTLDLYLTLKKACTLLLIEGHVKSPDVRPFSQNIQPIVTVHNIIPAKGIVAPLVTVLPGLFVLLIIDRLPQIVVRDYRLEEFGNAHPSPIVE
jgi:hypothetical protein